MLKWIHTPHVSENWDTWNGRTDELESQQNEHEPHCEDPDFNVS